MTAIEILNKHFKDSIPESFEGEVWDERVIAAMEEYAEQEAKRIHSALKEQRISVEERLPEHNEMLVCCEIGRTKSFWASYDKRENVFICHEGFVVTVDYYQTLPAPPVKK